MPGEIDRRNFLSASCTAAARTSLAAILGSAVLGPALVGCPEYPTIPIPIINPPTPPPVVVDPIEAERLVETGVTAVVEDFYERTYSFADAQSLPKIFNNSWELPYQLGQTGLVSLTVEQNGVFYVCDFAQIAGIQQEKTGDNKTRVNTISGLVFDGQWIPNDRTTNFYRDSGHPLEEGYIGGYVDQAPSRIHISEVKEITFEMPPEEKQDSELPYYPKYIELFDGSAFETDIGFLMDFCGHYWRNQFHERMKDTCQIARVYDSSPKGVGYAPYPLADIREIEFLGTFDPDLPQCRHIIMRFLDGSEQEELLYLTSESYYGSESHSSRYRDYDKMYAKQDYGAALIPLDMVKKIIPIHEEV
ncbi:MAG: hypothetical protein V1740_03635 [Candidatus Woesearchaeota archaeon]